MVCNGKGTLEVKIWCAENLAGVDKDPDDRWHIQVADLPLFQSIHWLVNSEISVTESL